MPVDTGKALKTFSNDYMLAALEADPVAGVLRAAKSGAIYAQMLQVMMMVTGPVVSGWKLKLLDSRTDALVLRSMAALVNNAVAEKRQLADADLLEACFHRIAQRCPSALNHMSSPDWQLARDAVADPDVPEVQTPPKRADAPTGALEPEAIATPRKDEPRSLNQGFLSPDTSAKLEQAAREYGVDELQATLNDAPNLVTFHDLDRATQISIDTVTKQFASDQSQSVQRYCGSTVITGYVVGRAMLGTAGGALHYSNPLTEADNAETLIRFATTEDAAPIAEAIGPAGLLFVKLQEEMAGRQGPLAALPEERRSVLAGGSAIAGLVIAIAEHDLFAA